MAYTVIIVGLCVIFAIVLSILNYYGDRKTSPWYVKLSVIIGWFVSFSIILVLPLDITSSIYRSLTDEEKQNTEPPIGYQSEEFFTIFWNNVYWISYVLTWLALPLLSGYILSGHFTPLKKFKDSIYQNILFYGVLGGIGVIFVIYIAIARQMTGKALIAFLMAMSNAWGLLLCIVFLGYGLVDIPRLFWRQSDLTWIQNYYQFKAPKLKDDSLNASEELQKVVRDIFKISNSSSFTSQNPLRNYLEKLIELCPITNDDTNNNYDDNDSNFNEHNITLDDLATLNYRLKNAILANKRCDEEYKELINKALHVEDILNYKDSPNRMVELPFIASNPNTWFSKLKYKLAWLWYFKIRPYIYLTISILLIILSISIIWSEVTFQLSDSNISLFYIYLKYSRLVSYIFFELVIVILLIYMCLCTYTSLFKLQLFQYYHLFPHHHTDDNSLVFCAAYLCRLLFPLCYNFLNLTDNSQTAFSKIMGKIDLVPLLGKEFNGYVPIMMVIFTFVTFFNIHGKILKYFGVDSHFGIDHFSTTNENDQDEIQDGKYLIEQARQDRNHPSNINTKYDSTGYSNFNLRNAAKNNTNSNTYYNYESNNTKNDHDHRHTNPSVNIQNSTLDYPFHYKSQNQNYSYGAHSSNEYNQRYGSYSPSNGSTIYYSPSVGGGGHSSNATLNPQTFYPNKASSTTSASNTKNKTTSSSSSSIFSGLHSPFHSKSKNLNNSNPNNINSNSNNNINNNNNNNNNSNNNGNAKKKFGFNVNTDINEFYSNYPTLTVSHYGSDKNSHSSYHHDNNHLSVGSTTTTNGSHHHFHSNSNSNSHSNSNGSSSPSAKSSSSSSSTASSSRKLRPPSSSPFSVSGSSGAPATTNPKSKTRMFGLNYKLNG